MPSYSSTGQIDLVRRAFSCGDNQVSLFTWGAAGRDDELYWMLHKLSLVFIYDRLLKTWGTPDTHCLDFSETIRQKCLFGPLTNFSSAQPNAAWKCSNMALSFNSPFWSLRSSVHDQGFSELFLSVCATTYNNSFDCLWRINTTQTLRANIVWPSSI